MSILKWVNDANNDQDSYEYIVKYVTSKPYTDWDKNVRTKGCRKDAIIRDMSAVKKAYHKSNGKLYEHVVLSITPDHSSRKDSDYMEIGRRIADHYIGYQCAYALHKDTRIRHLHFVFNSVSYKDGKKFSQGPPDLNRIKMYVNTLLEEFDFDPIHSSPMEIIDTGEHFFSNGWRFLEIDDDQPDDRDMFRNTPPPNEEDDNTNYDVGSYFGISSSWYNNEIGGYNMNSSQYNQGLMYQGIPDDAPQSVPSGIPQNLPALSQATTISTCQGNNSGNGLNLININNIKLNSLDDLGQAIGDMNNAFHNAAQVGAEAMSNLRQRGVSDGVTVTTINNYYVGYGNRHEESMFNPIDVPYEEID